MRSMTKAIGLFVMSMLLVSPAYADQACDDEVTAILAVINSPPPGINPTDLDKAYALLNDLMKACASGATLADVQAIKDSLRSLLRIGS
jgi:hypothetical protein